MRYPRDGDGRVEGGKVEGRKKRRKLDCYLLVVPGYNKKCLKVIIKLVTVFKLIKNKKPREERRQ